MSKATETMRAAGLALPDVAEGVACEGTAIEKRTLKVAGKAFLFLGLADAMLKLEASIDEARAIEAKAPAHCKVGKGGWTKLALDGKAPAPPSVLARWVAESHALMRGAAPAKKAAQKKPSKKPATKALKRKTGASR